MSRIDIHTHAFHPKIADKVLNQLEQHYSITPVGTARIDDLLARERAAGIDRFVVLCAATAPAQVVPANNWTISLQEQHPEVIAFGTLHPDYEDWEAELDRLYEAGIKGLKFHPEFQGFWLDDPRLLPIVEAAQNRFAFIFHVGDRLPPKQNPSCPYKMAAIAKNFPKARILAAHMGGHRHWAAALEVLAGKNIWFDTSSTLPYIQDKLLCDIWRCHPRERICFGSDYPLFDPGEDMDLLRKRLHLSSTDLEELLHNGERLLAA